MADSPFEMRFDPQTINHLGVRMYATLPPALAEIVANAYDADATSVVIHLEENDNSPSRIVIEDDGCGLTHDEINSKFLVIGRNRRDQDGDTPSPVHKRMPIGKKGLGKLALFGLAKTICISTRREGKLNEFVLDWEELQNASGVYKPTATRIDEDNADKSGTTVTLSGLKRKTPFDPAGLADSISRMFHFSDDFQVIIQTPSGDRIALDNSRKYGTLDIQFHWDISKSKFIPHNSAFSDKKIRGRLMTSTKPIPPSSGLRGITLISRTKLVNEPEFFSSSTSSHFYQYLTGWISIDYIDELEDDVIATNRKSIDWDHPEMTKLRKFLAGIVSQVNGEWRRLRKEKKDEDLQESTGIDTAKWLTTMPPDIRESTTEIINLLREQESLETYTPVIKALHSLVPEYPLLHWRHLHDQLRDRVHRYYENEQYGDAASQGVQIYCEAIRHLLSSSEDGTDLVNRAFGSKPFSSPPLLQLNNLANDSEKNIQEGQGHLSRGVVTGFRNPICHAPIDTNVPATFSELDCLNILSLLSYLFKRLDAVTVNKPQPPTAKTT